MCPSCWIGDSDPPCLPLCLKSLFYGYLLSWVEVLGVSLKEFTIYYAVFYVLRFMSLLFYYILESPWELRLGFLQCSKLCPACDRYFLNISETTITSAEDFILYKVVPPGSAHRVSQWALRAVPSWQERKQAQWCYKTNEWKGTHRWNKDGLKATSSDLRCPCFLVYTLLPVKLKCGIISCRQLFLWVTRMGNIWREAQESFVEEMGLLEKGWEVCLERACSMANREEEWCFRRYSTWRERSCI